MKKNFKYPTVATIAGFDSSGGAGIQADIKTISALGCYATSILTALPVQNTTGVKNMYTIPAQAVADQIDVVFEDVRPDAIKIGMVHTTALVAVIASKLKEYPDIPVVFDPVMVATSGHKLIEDDTIEAIQQELFPLATIITPNLDEAAVLCNKSITTLEQMYTSGKAILQLGCVNVLLKGGHLQEETLTSLLFTSEGKIESFATSKIDTNNTHGSGCTLSSAIASYLALGFTLLEAVTHAQNYVDEAIQAGSDVLVGKGNGPLNHFYQPKPMKKYEME